MELSPSTATQPAAPLCHTTVSYGRKTPTTIPQPAKKRTTKVLHALYNAGTSTADADDHTDLKNLIESLTMLLPIAASQYCDSALKSRILLCTVSRESWYLHADSKLSSRYNFSAVVDPLHASILCLCAHNLPRPIQPAQVRADTLLLNPANLEPDMRPLNPSSPNV